MESGVISTLSDGKRSHVPLRQLLGYSLLAEGQMVRRGARKFAGKGAIPVVTFHCKLKG